MLERRVFGGLLLLTLAGGLCSGAVLDLSQAVVSAPDTFTGLERKAVEVLLEEVEKRSQIRWPLGASGVAVIELRLGSGAAEGYSISTRTAEHPSVVVSGNDARGLLYGVGHLLRKLEMTRGRVALAEPLHVTTAPRYPLRGHQLGYRPKTNSYDAWTVAMWDHYIRDLAIFGANAIELLPPRTDDDADSPHFPLPQMRMMAEMSRIASEYGMAVWVWYPALDKDYSDPATVEAALTEWGEVFRNVPRIDAVFVPAGDPGHTPPKYIIALHEKQTPNLRKYHPRAQMWMSPQGFTKEWMDEFYGIMNQQQPAWLAGVVHGPQVPVDIYTLRERIPKKYPIRNYPDITHSRQCQFPVPDWDVAHAMTIAREGVNPRPRGMAAIFRYSQPPTIGFITYSEGCNDDVNKALWSALGWNPDADVVEILRDYARYYINPAWADAYAQALLALENNWRAPLVDNAGVDTPWAQFHAMELAARPQDLLNWRFQQGLYRAYYDAYTQNRLIYETELERRAMDHLRAAGETGSLVALKRAEAALDEALTTRIAPDLRARVYELAEALYQSIRMQLSVVRYKAIDVGRGANLDTVEFPLNNREWLKARFAEIRSRAQESERLAGIREIVDWTNPGPGGFYDDLGKVNAQPHLVRGAGFEKDPQFWRSSLLGFAAVPGGRISSMDYAEALHEQPLEMHYTNLDRKALYKVRVVYSGDMAREVRMLADSIEVHPFIKKPVPVRPLEVDNPPQATVAGELTLRWYRRPGRKGDAPYARAAWMAHSGFRLGIRPFCSFRGQHRRPHQAPHGDPGRFASLEYRLRSDRSSQQLHPTGVVPGLDWAG